MSLASDFPSLYRVPRDDTYNESNWDLERSTRYNLSIDEADFLGTVEGIENMLLIAKRGGKKGRCNLAIESSRRETKEQKIQRNRRIGEIRDKLSLFLLSETQVICSDSF